jgi:pimeloyl-ACP methyl ester carboxylesterase
MKTPSHVWLLLNGAAARHAKVVQPESKLKAISEANRLGISSMHGSEGSITMRGNDVSRRSLLVSGAVLGAGATVGGVQVAAAAPVADAMAPVPMPSQVAAKEAMADIPGTRLWYWDTGGNGVPVVLLHPASGSALIWGYQQPVFAKAGYRVIAYSRRGYYNSAAYDKANPGVGSEDLHNLVASLGIAKFHIVASAAGGSVASDYAFSHQDRLLSLTISSNSFGVRDGEIGRAADAIRPKSFDELPVEFRELGPSYRAANPEGTKRWVELEHKALVGTEYRQKLANEIKQSRLKELKLPVLVMAGAADVATPPSIARMIAAEIPNSELAIGPEAGHSVYWEQPEMFNRAVLDFIGKHGK